MAKVIGYMLCSRCGQYTHIYDPNQIKIYYHPDDASSAIADCKHCGAEVCSKIHWDHARNFMMHGVKCYSVSDKYDRLTEDEIEGWDINSELDAFLGDDEPNIDS